MYLTYEPTPPVFRSITLGYNTGAKTLVYFDEELN